MNNFEKLGLSEDILRALDKLGFTEPTPVQQKAIPLLLSNNPTDFIGLAQTGTGKTAAFGLPLIDLIDADISATQALVMAPTRELGQQTGKQLVDFSAGIKKVNVEVVYGGANIVTQIKALKKPVQIVVATPGRLLDLIRRKAVSLDQVRYVVLDEADEMLNMGFKEDIDEILSHTKEGRSTWLFSATMPPDIRKIVNKYMNEPLEVAVNTEQKSNADIAHKYVVTKTANKLAAVRRFLDIQPDMRGIMFCRTKRETQEIADKLFHFGYGVEALHGDLSQAQRDGVMKRFKSRSMQLLIATDVAARGIDVSDLTHVFHHTLPDQLESYTHRSGRTGRAGRKGVSLAFINPREGRKIQELERKIKVTFECIDVPNQSDLKSSRIHTWAGLIINTQVDPQAEELVKDIESSFAHLSKEDLLKRLVTTQLDNLMLEANEDDNLNEQQGGGKSGGQKSSGSGTVRYFINIGTIDGMTKGDLVHFISDVCGLDRQYIGQLEMQKSRSYLFIDAGQDEKLSLKFEGVEVEGRAIRMNRDDSFSGPAAYPKGKKKREARGFHASRPKKGGRQGRRNRR